MRYCQNWSASTGADTASLLSLVVAIALVIVAAPAAMQWASKMTRAALLLKLRGRRRC
jgi:hypothetical protein